LFQPRFQHMLMSLQQA